jgi:hypothetical protein
MYIITFVHAYLIYNEMEPNKFKLGVKNLDKPQAFLITISTAYQENDKPNLSCADFMT